jgi:integrase
LCFEWSVGAHVVRCPQVTMPQKRTDERWEHRDYAWAYVRNYRGKACTVIKGGAPKVTGVPWPTHPSKVTAAKKAALIILDKRVNEYLFPPKPAATDPDQMMCADLWRDFVRTRWDKLSDNNQRSYSIAFRLAPPGTPVSSTAAISSQIRENVANATLAQNTIRTRLTRVRSVFAYGIERGYLRVNPVHPDMIPDFEYKSAEPYTEKTMQKVLKTMKDSNMAEGRYYAYLLFLSGCGARQIEGVRLTWQTVFKDRAVVTSFKNKRAGRHRIIPFDLCPIAKQAIEFARAHRKQWGTTRPTDPVFGLKTEENVYANVRLITGKGLKHIRKYVVNKWKREGWPDKVRDAIVGHEREISEAHYETEYSASELVSMMLGSQKAK